MIQRKVVTTNLGSVCLCLPSAHRLHPPYHFDISPLAAAAAAAASTYAASDEVKWAFAASGGRAAAGTTTRHATKATTSMIGKLLPFGDRLGEIWTYIVLAWVDEKNQFEGTMISILPPKSPAIGERAIRSTHEMRGRWAYRARSPFAPLA